MISERGKREQVFSENATLKMIPGLERIISIQFLNKKSSVKIITGCENIKITDYRRENRGGIFVKSRRYVLGILAGLAVYSLINLMVDVPFSNIFSSLSIVGGLAFILMLFIDAFRMDSDRYVNLGIVLVMYWAITAFSIVIGFSSIYLDLIRLNLNHFSGLVDGSTAIYFSLNTFVTVGFGDIYPVSPLAKALVMSEIMVTIIVLPITISTFVAGIVSNRIKLQSDEATNEFHAKKPVHLSRIK